MLLSQTLIVLNLKEGVFGLIQIYIHIYSILYAHYIGQLLPIQAIIYTLKDMPPQGTPSLIYS